MPTPPKPPPPVVPPTPLATVEDVVLRWGRPLGDAESALVELRLADVERLIIRTIPDLRKLVGQGVIQRADAVQVECDAVIRLLRNPEGYISETDGDYTYQLTKELASGRLSLFDEDWAALGHRRSKMSILVPEPIVESDEWLDADGVPAGSGIQVFLTERDLPADDSVQLAVTKDKYVLWLRDPGAVNANKLGWVAVGAAASALADGTAPGQLLTWNAVLSVWEAGVAPTGDGYTLSWSLAKSQWQVSANRLQDLTDVSASARAVGGALTTGDVLAWDDPSKRWVVSAPSAFVSQVLITSPSSGDALVWNGTNWVNVPVYSIPDIDAKLSGLASGLARKPAVQDIVDVPPAAPTQGATWIVGKAPTGAFAGHPDEVVFWDGTAWVFANAAKGDTHTVLATNQSMTWNGTDWVSVGSQASKLSELSDVSVGAVVAKDDALMWDGTKWVNQPVPAPAAGPVSDHTDVDTSGAVDKDVLTFTGADGIWRAVTPPPNTLDGLDDVAIGAAADDGDMLTWDAGLSQWVNKAPAALGVPLDNLTDVEATDPDDGDVLRWNDFADEWEASPLYLSTIADVDNTATPAEADSLVFDSATGLWTPKPLTVGDLADVEVVSAAKGDVLGFDGTGWVEHTPALVDCYDVDLTTPPADGEVLTWDGSAWVASPTGVGSGPVVADLEDLQDVNVGVPNDGDMLTWDQGEWIAARPRLADLTDVDDDESGNAPGDVLTWDDGSQKWVASAPAEPVPDGSVDKDVLSWDTTAQDWVPRQQTLSGLSDVQADSAAAGDVLSFNGSGWQEKTLAISDLDDVNTTGVLVPAVNDGLAWDGAHWVPSKAAATGYTKPEVDQLLIDTAKTVNDRVDAAVLGMVHGTAVLAILSTPPATPVEGQSWIVGRAATGAWATHENKIASWIGGAWAFLQPDTKATHLVEDQAALYSFNGTSWVKVASTVAASGTTAQRGVGEIIPWALDTIPADYLECKGQIVAVLSYPDLYAVIGNKYNAGTAADGVSTFALPDLQGYFLRGVGGAGGEAAVGAVQGDTTRKPNTNFTVTSTGTTSTTGSHHHDFWRSAANFSGDGKYQDTQFSPINQGATGRSVSTGIQNAGDHSHTVTVNGNVVGGDAETRPKSVSVRWVMRVLPVNGGAVGPEGKPGVGVPAVTTADNEKVMTVVKGVPAWAAPTKRGVGEIVPWALDTIPADYLECKGQILAVTTYADLYAVIGNAYNTGTAADGTSTFALPDLRGYFLRGAGARGGEGRAGVVQDDTTRLPRTAFTGTTDSAGSHRHGFTDNHRPVVTDLGGHDLAVGPGGNAEGAFNVAADGAHTHTVTLAGGDPETRPKNFSVRWVIRVLPINGGAAGPAGAAGNGVPAITAADEGKILQVAAGTALWQPVAAASSGPKVYTNRAYVDIAAGANNYVLEGGVWMLTSGYLTLKCWSDAGVTQLTPDPATWKMQGHTYESMAAESTFTTDSTTANLITTRGWDVVNKDITMGKNWVGTGENVKWMKFRLFINTTTSNGRDDHPYIQAEWEYTSDQNKRCTGGLTFSPPNKTTILRRISVVAGSAVTSFTLTANEGLQP